MFRNELDITNCHEKHTTVTIYELVNWFQSSGCGLLDEETTDFLCTQIKDRGYMKPNTYVGWRQVSSFLSTLCSLAPSLFVLLSGLEIKFHTHIKYYNAVSDLMYAPMCRCVCIQFSLALSLCLYIGGSFKKFPE
jgi:hypothetical protein